MDDINKPDGDNMGGLICFKFIPVESIARISAPVKYRICEIIELAPASRWYEVYATPGTLKFTEDQTDSDHGDYFNKKLSAVIPKDRTELSLLYNEMKNKQFIVDYMDANGLRKIVGTLSEPLRFKSALDTGSDVPQRNAHTVEFSGDGKEKSYTYFI